MSARARLVAIVAGSVAAVVVLAAVIGAHTGELRRAKLAEARDAHLLNALRDSVESRLAIGLGFEQLEALQPVIERERASASEIVSIDVFSATGVLAYSTDPGAVGRSEAREWVPQLAAPGLWRIERPLERVVGTRVENDLGEALGGIGVTIADSHNALPSADAGTLPDLGLMGGLAALGVALVIAAGVLAWLGCAGLLREYRRVAAALSGLADAPGDGLLGAAATRQQHWAQAEQVIEQGVARLRELDDGA